MSDRVDSIEQLEALYPGKLSPATTEKETPVINDEYRQIIEACPFFAIASIGPEGMDCSPRGDGPGFIKILDDKTLAVPDRRGNNRLDTLRNIVRDGRIALLMLIPGINETFRINGRAEISTNADLLDAMTVDGKRPVSAIIIHIETMYFQCARALIRSKLWDAESRRDPKSLPTAGKLIQSAMPEFVGDEYDDVLLERQVKTLY